MCNVCSSAARPISMKLHRYWCCETVRIDVFRETRTIFLDWTHVNSLIPCWRGVSHRSWINCVFAHQNRIIFTEIQSKARKIRVDADRFHRFVIQMYDKSQFVVFRNDIFFIYTPIVLTDTSCSTVFSLFTPTHGYGFSKICILLCYSLSHVGV